MQDSEPDPGGVPSDGGRFALVLGLLCAVTLAGFWSAMAVPSGRRYTSDQYAYQLLGHSLLSRGAYASPAVRDFYGPRELPQPSRSFPPLWPLAVALCDRLTGAGIAAGALLAFALLLPWLLAGGLLARRLAPSRWPLLWLALPSFFASHRAFRFETEFGNTEPLALLLTFALGALAVRAAGRPPRMRDGAAAGLLLALLALARFDHLPFAAITALAATWWLLRPGPARSRRAAAALLATLAAALAPWVARNLAVFGAPFASDGALSALSTGGREAALSYFAPGAAPATAFGDFPLWFSQRAEYFARNTALLLPPLEFALLPAAVALYFAHRKFTPADRAWITVSALHLASTLAAVSLTPYEAARYLSVDGALLLFTAALTVARALPERSPLAASAAALFLATPLPGMFLDGATTVRLAGTRRLLAAAQPPPTREKALKRQAARFREGIPSNSLTISENAEELAYYGAGFTIYPPRNTKGCTADFRAWLRRWRPTHLAADAEGLRRLGFSGAAAGPGSGAELQPVERLCPGADGGSRDGG